MRTRVETLQRKSAGKEQATPIWESHFDFPFLKLREAKESWELLLDTQLWPWRWGCDCEHLLFSMGVYLLMNNKSHEHQRCLSQKILPFIVFVFHPPLDLGRCRHSSSIPDHPCLQRTKNRKQMTNHICSQWIFSNSFKNLWSLWREKHSGSQLSLHILRHLKRESRTAWSYLVVSFFTMAEKINEKS